MKKPTDKSPKQLKGVTIKAKPIKRGEAKSVTSYGEVPTRKIDSVRRANPSAGKAIGTGYKGSGGMTTYGRDASEVIKKTVKKK